MAVDIEEAYSLLEFLKRLKHEKGGKIAEQMVGKFKGIVPEGTSSVDPYDSIAFATAETTESEIFVTRDKKLIRNIRAKMHGAEPEEILN